EWLLVLTGAVGVRTRDGEQQLERGDVACFSPGPSGAHKVTNRGEATSRVVMSRALASQRSPSIPTATRLAFGRVTTTTPGCSGVATASSATGRASVSGSRSHPG